VDIATLSTFMTRQPELRRTWEGFLRLEKTTSPLANPDALVHLIDTTLREVFNDLRFRSPRRHPTRAAAAHCPCGRNPLLAYYAAGRQALREGLIGVQIDNPGQSHDEREEDLQVLDEVFDQIARREIEAFCGICQFRGPQHAEPLEHAGHCSRAR
jgi:hypothetical protein